MYQAIFSQTYIYSFKQICRRYIGGIHIANIGPGTYEKMGNEIRDGDEEEYIKRRGLEWTSYML